MRGGDKALAPLAAAISDRARDHGPGGACDAPARTRGSPLRFARGRCTTRGSGSHALGPPADRRGAGDALAMIEPLAGKLGGYFYFHGARGAFLLQLGRTEEARAAFGHAIALANTAAEAAHIRGQLDRLARGAAL